MTDPSVIAKVRAMYSDLGHPQITRVEQRKEGGRGSLSNPGRLVDVYFEPGKGPAGLSCVTLNLETILEYKL